MEYSSYLIYLLGIVLDYVTTKIGISHFHLVEANVLTHFLIQRGLWLTTNLLMFLVTMLITSLVLKNGDVKHSYIALASPTMCGMVRIFVGVQNLILIIS